MKFKYLIILFINIIIFTVFITALFPQMLSGFDIPDSLRYIVWAPMILMLLLLISLVIFYLLNYRLHSLLEREDWPALAFYLEQDIYIKGRYSSRKVRLLASSYLVISDYASVIKLENKVIHVKPSVVRKNALLFGSARVLSGNHGEAAAFFKSNMHYGNAHSKCWMRWYFGFSQLLSGLFDGARIEFSSLAVSSEDALITGLSAYFLDGSLARNSSMSGECREIAGKGRSRVVLNIKNNDNWNKEAKKRGNEIHIVIIRKYIDEAGKWLFSKN